MIGRQFSLYITVGVISAATDVGLMQCLILLGANHLIAASVGFFAGLLLNFFLHSKITFQKQCSTVTFTRYMAVVFFNLALTLIVVQLFHDWFSMPVLGKLVALPLIAINGFLLSKYWIYRPS
jgi:putative flippase GtrA